jgi:hypothetical protein
VDPRSEKFPMKKAFDDKLNHLREKEKQVSACH